MSRFITALVDNVMNETLRSQWDSIKEEYYELSQNKSFSATYFLLRDIHYLNTKLENIQTAVDELRGERKNTLLQTLRKNKASYMSISSKIDELEANHKANMIAILHEHGFDFSFSDENLHDELSAVIIQSQSEALELEQMREEWEKMCKKSDQTKPTRNYFGKWLDVISDRAERTLDPHKISVAEYCRRCNEYQETAMRQAAKNRA